MVLFYIQIFLKMNEQSTHLAALIQIHNLSLETYIE